MVRLGAAGLVIRDVSRVAADLYAYGHGISGARVAVVPETRRRFALDIPWRTLVKVLAAAALVWVWLRLWQLVLLVIVVVILAVTLDPPVRWLQNKGWRRAAAAAFVAGVLAAALAGFAVLTWASIQDQLQTLGTHVGQTEQSFVSSLPEPIRKRLGGGGKPEEFTSQLMPRVARFGRAAANAAGVFVLAFILTIYVLIEDRQTYAWFRAFVPRQHRPKFDQTAAEGRRIVGRYVVANAATSLVAAICTYVVLLVLDVPAALVLALLAGLSDFVPVVGFLVSLVPAVILALTVSPATAIVVVVAYCVYNAFEQYYLGPKLYGGQLALSNVAVLLAFAIGAQLAGVVGALIALPVAALYPTVERIWLREELEPETIRDHAALQQRKAG
jgi:predicted PurR-regulated permease PerM